MVEWKVVGYRLKKLQVNLLHKKILNCFRIFNLYLKVEFTQQLIFLLS